MNCAPAEPEERDSRVRASRLTNEALGHEHAGQRLGSATGLVCAISFVERTGSVRGNLLSASALVVVWLRSLPLAAGVLITLMISDPQPSPGGLGGQG